MQPEEGTICLDAYCCGYYIWKEVENCNCHTMTMPPCSACENLGLICDSCGYTPEEHEILEEDTTMHNSKIIFLLNDSVRAIKACYEVDGTPEWFKTVDPTVVVGDLVVIENAQNTGHVNRHGCAVVKVTEVDAEPDLTNNHEIRWVTQKIDSAQFERLREMENAAIEKVNAVKRQEEKAKLRKSLMADREGEFDNLAITNINAPDPVASSGDSEPTDK